MIAVKKEPEDFGTLYQQSIVNVQYIIQIFGYLMGKSCQINGIKL